MNFSMTRRQLLQAGLISSLPIPAFAQERKFEPAVGPWRTFELTTTVTVAEPKGVNKLWLPVPDLDTDWQKTLGNEWSGNATRASLANDPARGVRMVYAEFDAAVTAPTLTVTSKLQTRNEVASSRRQRCHSDAQQVTLSPAGSRECAVATAREPRIDHRQRRARRNSTASRCTSERRR